MWGLSFEDFQPLDLLVYVDVQVKQGCLIRSYLSQALLVPHLPSIIHFMGGLIDTLHSRLKLIAGAFHRIGFETQLISRPFQRNLIRSFISSLLARVPHRIEAKIPLWISSTIRARLMLLGKGLYFLVFHRLLLLYHFVQLGLLCLLLKYEVVNMTDLPTFFYVLFYFVAF